MSAIKALAIVCLVCISAGCGLIGGLDPAEKLAVRIEKESSELKISNSERLEFEFTPDVHKLNSSPRYDGRVTLEFVVTHEPDEKEGYSVMRICSWFRTTYHNRFIRISKSLGASKDADEAFYISIRKTSDEIELYEIR